MFIWAISFTQSFISSYKFCVHFYSNVLDSGLCVWIRQKRIMGILVAEQESQTSAVACKKCRSFSVIPVAKFSMYQCLLWVYTTLKINFLCWYLMFSERLGFSEIYCHVVTVFMMEAARTSKTFQLMFTEYKIVSLQRPKWSYLKNKFVLRDILRSQEYYGLNFTLQLTR
jgi:hypothetical protein